MVNKYIIVTQRSHTKGAIMEGAYGVVVAPEGEVDLVLEQQVLDIGPELARNGLIGSVADVTVWDPSSSPSPPPPQTNPLSHRHRRLQEKSDQAVPLRVNVHGPVARKDHPGRLDAVYLLQILLEPLPLHTACVCARAGNAQCFQLYAHVVNVNVEVHAKANANAKG
jgi:hypothetical protein